MSVARRSRWAAPAALALLLLISAPGARAAGDSSETVARHLVRAGKPQPLALGVRPGHTRLRRDEANPDLEHRETSDPEDAPAKPTSPETPDGGALASAASTDTFTLFKNTLVEERNSEQIAEPTIANDGPALFATGNVFAAMSPDDGTTWIPVDPREDETAGGFCCDQIALPVEHGGTRSIVWLRQYYKNKRGSNVLRLTVFRNGADMLDGISACTTDLRPHADFGFKSSVWFDYNALATTKKYVYLTTNAHDADKHDRTVGVVVARAPRADFAGTSCTQHWDYWVVKSHKHFITPVQNAGSTMFFGQHVHDVDVFAGDELRIYSIADSSDKLKHKDRDIKNFASRRKTMKCKGPFGGNSCRRLTPDFMAGFEADGLVGFLWTAAQDSEFPFPQVRVAVFASGDLELVDEAQIFNRHFAWVLPEVAVNRFGELGVTIDAMGGDHSPTAEAFVLEDAENWNDVRTHVVQETPGSATDWGDYSVVRTYEGCPNSFLAHVWTTPSPAIADTHAIWFGDFNQGCTDLAVTAVLAFPGDLVQGDDLSIISTTRDIGSQESAGSETAYYLSRDPAQSRDDIRLADTVIPHLFAGNQFSAPVLTVRVPTDASGTYYVLGCADDAKAVQELDNDNNCLSVSTVTVRRPDAKAAGTLRSIAPSALTQLVRLHARLPVATALSLPPGAKGPTTVSYYLARKPLLGGAGARPVRIGRFSVAGNGGAEGRTLNVRHVLRLPRRVTTRRLQLVACVGGGHDAARCLPARRPLYVVQ